MKNLLNKNDKIFVAGHKGMVGKAIIRSLKEKGYCDKKLDGKWVVKPLNSNHTTLESTADLFYFLVKLKVELSLEYLTSRFKLSISQLKSFKTELK